MVSVDITPAALQSSQAGASPNEAPTAPRPKVSVLLSSYNHEAFVQEAIDSVLQQSFADFELIIIDDASSDGSWEVIAGNTDARVRAYRNASRKGAVNNANWALRELVQGEFVAIHHSDDAWTPEKLECQLAAFAADPGLGAVFTWVRVIDEHGTTLDNDWFNRPSANRWSLLGELFLEENHLAHPSALIRRQCYDRSGLYDPLLVQTPDADMWCRLLLDWPIEIIPEQLTLHRLFSNRSNTSSTARADVRVRTANEWNHLRRHFLRVAGADDVFRIFPALRARLAVTDQCPVAFLVAMACLHESTSRNAWQLGIELLQKAMGDTATRRAIEQACGFSAADLAHITGSRDPFGVLDGERFAHEYAALEKTAIDAHADATRSWQEVERSRATIAALSAERDTLEREHAAYAKLACEHEALAGEHGRLQAAFEQLGGERERLQAAHDELSQQLERIRQHRGYKLYVRIRNGLKKLKLLKHD